MDEFRVDLGFGIIFRRCEKCFFLGFRGWLDLVDLIYIYKVYKMLM